MGVMGKLRPVLFERSGGRCEVSGRHIDFETFDMHHRRNKGMGGSSRDNTDALENLLALDPGVHNGGPESVHGRRQWSERYGYLVPKHVADPGMWPVFLLGRRWVLLGGDGGYYPLPSLPTGPTPGGV